MMCMHDNPHCIKVEVEDIDACPSPARKITGEVTINDLQADAANLKALAEAATMASAAATVVAKEMSVDIAARPSATTSAAAKKEEGMLECALKIIEYSGVFLDHNLIGSQVEVVGTGEKQCNCRCKLHIELPCGSQLCMGSFVCFCKNRFAWFNGKDEDVLEVFVLKNGMLECKVGYLPKHLAARAKGKPLGWSLCPCCRDLLR